MVKLYTLIVAVALSSLMVGCASKPSHEELHKEAMQAQADADRANQRLDALENQSTGYSK